MLKRLLRSFVGIFALLLYALNVIFWCTLLFIIAIFSIIPWKPWRQLCQKGFHQFATYWIDCNTGILNLTTNIQWDIQGTENLKINDWYLVIANHQSWSDILILTKVFNHKIPLLKFFMKRELLWQLPIAAQACWIMDFPFMQRYSKEYLKKHPEMKGKDMETTRKSCEKFKTIPTSVISFPEGTRFTKQKHRRQNSPYKYLLKPKAGGVGFVLTVMGGILHEIVNVTIVYPDFEINMWDFLCGNVKRIIVRVETHEITKDLIGDYENDREYRTYFQNWLNNLWREKDLLIDKFTKLS